MGRSAGSSEASGSDVGAGWSVVAGAFTAEGGWPLTAGIVVAGEGGRGLLGRVMLAESGGDLVLPARVLCASTERSDKYQGKGRAGEDPVITAATHGASPKVRMSFTRALAATRET